MAYDPAPCIVRVIVPADPAIVRVPVPADVPAVRLETPGPMGPAGPTGSPGPGLSTLAIAQSMPSVTWTLAHGLNRFPSVTLVDTAGDRFEAETRYLDANTITVTLSAPTAGTAYLN